MPFPPGTIGSASRQDIVDAFERVYRRLYGRVADAVALEVVNWRVTVSGPVPSLDCGDREPRTRRCGAQGTPSGLLRTGTATITRLLCTTDTASVPATAIAGPAIVEERESTAVLGPAAIATVDELSNLIVSLSHAA